MLTLSYLQRAQDRRGEGRGGLGQRSTDKVRREKLQAMGGECGTSVGKGGRGIMVETHRRLMKTTGAM